MRVCVCVCVYVYVCVYLCVCLCVCDYVSTPSVYRNNCFHLLLSLEDAKYYVEIFTQMNRQSQLQSYYNSCRKVRSTYVCIRGLQCYIV